MITEGGRLTDMACRLFCCVLPTDSSDFHRFFCYDIFTAIAVIATIAKIEI